MCLASRLFVVLFSAAGLAAQQLVLPDNHYLCESATQLGNTGAGTWWRNGPGRFQVIYEASHFLGKAGANGPVFITRLKFRGEDGEPNLGGQVYTGVSVQLGSTSLNNTNMSTTFATNLAPMLPNTTTMGLAGTTNVTVQPSIGSTPNNWCIDIDLLSLGTAFLFDPTGPEPNLLINITVPAAPSNAAPLILIPMQDTTGGSTVVRGEGVYATTAGAATGTTSTAPPVIGIEFAGSGGFPALEPARNERYGAACGGQCSTFYEGFLNGQAFDLVAGLTLFPDNIAAPTFYTVAPGAPPVDLTQLNASPNSTTDDALVTHTLGFTHRYPGGSTTTIKACTNGFVWVDSAMTVTTWIPVIAEMLGTSTNATARYMVFWMDLAAGRNVATHPNCGLHVKTDTSGGAGNAVCYVTWYKTSLYRVDTGTGVGGHSVLTFQCVLHEATGVVEYRYLEMPAFIGNNSTSAGTVPTVVGWTRGRLSSSPITGSVDPQSRDLSVEVPFATAVEGARGHMGQTITATPDVGGQYYGGRAFGGQSLTFGAVNVPPGSILGVQLLDTAASRPGLQLPGIVVPGCMLSTSIAPVLWEAFVIAGPTVTGTPALIPHGLEGLPMYAQFVVLDGLLLGGDYVTVASNAVKLTFGLD